ncbi:MAG: Trm112 family protein [Hyphomicrobiaceae bacterium]|nr:Trm112 family protein [Hyphomicrobiaceae bacterium]
MTSPSDDEKPNTGEVSSVRPAHIPVDPRLLEILVCPVTKTRLLFDAERQELVSRAAGLAYPIRDGVPLMTVEAARQLSGT